MRLGLVMPANSWYSFLILEVIVQRFRRQLAALACIVVGVASFAISYVALSEVAVTVEAVPAGMGWLVPIVIDGGIICGSAVIWTLSTESARRPTFPFFFVGFLVVVSVIVNIAHAGDSMLAKGIAALPPLILLGALELVASQGRRLSEAAKLLEAEEVERENVRRSEEAAEVEEKVQRLERVAALEREAATAAADRLESEEAAIAAAAERVAAEEAALAAAEEAAARVAALPAQRAGNAAADKEPAKPRARRVTAKDPVAKEAKEKAAPKAPRAPAKAPVRNTTKAPVESDALPVSTDEVSVPAPLEPLTTTRSRSTRRPMVAAQEPVDA